MPTSGVLECNQNFKYPKKLPAALNSSILAENGAGSTNNSYFIMPPGCVLHWNQNIESAKNCLRRQKKRERKREGRKLFIKSAKASRPSAKRERRASGWEKWHPVKKYLRQLWKAYEGRIPAQMFTLIVNPGSITVFDFWKKFKSFKKWCIFCQSQNSQNKHYFLKLLTFFQKSKHSFWPRIWNQRENLHQNASFAFIALL